jgi:hypothetical protein
MDFISVQGFDVHPGKLSALQEWLSKHDAKLREHAPEGCEYIGTYIATQTSEKHAGNVFSLWRLDSYGAQDAMATAGAEDGKFREMVNEFLGFIDLDSQNWSSILLKSVVDATMYAGM